MPLNTIITKLENGNVEINNGVEIYSLNGDIQVVKKSDLIYLRHKSGSIIDTIFSADVIKVIRVDTTEVPIAGNTTLLYNELSRYFFFKLAGNGNGTGITVVDTYNDLPLASSVPGSFYWVESAIGTKWLPGSFGGTYYARGMYYSNGTYWTFHDVPYQATLSQVNNGINNSEFVTPYTLANSNFADKKFAVNLADAEASVVRTFAGGETTYAVTHGFTDLDVQTEVYSQSTGARVITDVIAVSTTVVNVVFNGNSTDNTYRVVIVA